MKSLKILSFLLQDASVNTGADTTRDLITIRSRFEHEGQSFFSITLPTFDSWLLASLEEEVAIPSIRSSFRKKAGSKSVLPCFLHGLTERVFEPKTGRLRSDACPTAIFFIRQVCNAFKKVKVDCTPKRNAAALDSYRETDFDLRKVRSFVLTSFEEKVFSEISTKMESLWDLSSHCMPKHGPGATADKLVGNSKYTCRTWYKRWNSAFSFEELYGFSVERGADDQGISVTEEQPVKVVLVPKVLKGPRVIACEPTAMQYAQQYVSARLRATLTESGFGSQIGFTDQTVNRNLALDASIDRRMATMDLSEASDRVSCSLVRAVFSKAPKIRKQVFAVRSSKAWIPTHSSGIFNLTKYASMGSATTFPVEAICFYAIAVAAVAESKWHQVIACSDTGLSGKAKSLYHVLAESYRQVFVYGDDIIVPAESCVFVAGRLEAFGLKVNWKKTFFKGPFRESCGMDAFRGHDVTPTYVRSLPPATTKDATEVASWVALSNQLFLKGCWKTSKAIEKFLWSITPHLPLVGPKSTGLGFVTFTGAFDVQRFSKTTGQPQVRAWVLTSKKKRDLLDGESALLKHHLSLGVQESSDHLQHSVDKYSSRLRLRWVDSY